MLKIIGLAALPIVAATSALAGTITQYNPSFTQNWGDGGTGNTAITATRAPTPAETGSLEFNSSSSASPAIALHQIPGGGIFGTLGDLARGSIGLDWFKASTSTVAANQTFEVTLLVASDVNISNFALLTWQFEHNNAGAAATDQWVSEDLSNQLFWIEDTTRPYNVAGGYQTLSWFAAGNQVTDGSQTSTALDDDWFVFGLRINTGFSWSGSFHGSIDNVRLNFDGSPDNVSNFETQVIPLPAAAWAGLAGLAMIPVARRLRSSL